MQPFIAFSLLSLTYLLLRWNIPIRKSSETDSSNDAIVEINNLSYEYKKGQPVLKGLTLKIQRGQMVAIVGPNGAGKSTLFRLMI